MKAPTVREGVRLVVSLLPRRDRLVLAFMAVLQVALGLLDLVGVLLIAALSGLLVSGLVHHSHAGSGLPHWLPVQSTSSKALLAYGAIAATLLMLKSAISVVLLNRIFNYLAGRETFVATSLTRALLSAPLTVVQQEQTHINAFAVGQGVTQLVTQLMGNALTAAGDISLLLLMALALLVVNPVMTVVTVAYFAAVGAILYRFIARQASAAGFAATDANNHSVGAVMEAQLGFRELSVLNRRDFYVGRFQDLRRVTAHKWARLLLLAQLPKTVLEAVLVMAVVLLAATQLFSSNPAEVSTMLALFMAASARILPSVIRLQGSLTAMSQAVSTSGPTVQLVQRLHAVAIARGLVDAKSTGNLEAWAATRLVPPPTGSYPGFSPRVALRDVTYTHEGAGAPAVHGVCLEVAEGEHVALVGPSGAGKSTLLDLMLGVLEPRHGTVEVSGLQPGEAIDQWPGAIAYVPQSAFLTTGTICENVALGVANDDVDVEAVWAALSVASLDQLVASLPHGLETRLGERGFTLSGGERQRLGLARALYSRPRLLLLDEATSALDADTERSVTDALRETHGDATTVTVAHRWSTVRHADRIYYLAAGEIVASGSFERLLDLVPDFARQASLMGLQ